MVGLPLLGIELHTASGIAGGRWTINATFRMRLVPCCNCTRELCNLSQLYALSQPCTTLHATPESQLQEYSLDSAWYSGDSSNQLNSAAHPIPSALPVSSSHSSHSSCSCLYIGDSLITDVGLQNRPPPTASIPHFLPFPPQFFSVTQPLFFFSSLLSPH